MCVCIFESSSSFLSANSLELEALLHHFLDNRSHFRLCQKVAIILVPDLKHLTQLLLLLSSPFLFGRELFHAKSGEKVLSHDAELLEFEHSILIRIILIEKLLKTLDQDLLLSRILLLFFFKSFVNELVEF